VHARQVQIPGDDAVESQACTAVGRHARRLEHVDVFLDAGAGRVDALFADARLELGGEVDALAAREDFLGSSGVLFRGHY